MLSDNRQFYDLCRKYKYYYQAYKKIEHLKDIYWSKYIIDAHNEVKSKLDETENAIIFAIFYELLGDVIHYDVNRVFKDNSFQMWGCKPKVIGEDVTIHNKQKFNNKLKKYVEIMNKENIDRINYKK